MFESHGIEGFGCVPSPGNKYFWTFDRAGDYHYVCEPHITCCNMRGVIHVVPRPRKLDTAPKFDVLLASVGGRSDNVNAPPPKSAPAQGFVAAAAGAAATAATAAGNTKQMPTMRLNGNPTATPPAAKPAPAGPPSFLSMLALDGYKAPATDLPLASDDLGRASAAASGATRTITKAELSGASKHKVVNGDNDYVVDHGGKLVVNMSPSTTIFTVLVSLASAHRVVFGLLFGVVACFALCCCTLCFLSSRERRRESALRKQHLVLHTTQNPSLRID